MEESSREDLNKELSILVGLEIIDVDHRNISRGRSVLTIISEDVLYEIYYKSTSNMSWLDELEKGKYKEIDSILYNAHGSLCISFKGESIGNIVKCPIDITNVIVLRGEDDI